MEQYRLAQDGFDAVVAKVPADRWQAPSPCTEWSLRDIVGHVTWGQLQLKAWATGEDDPDPAGAPGAPHPAVMVGGDPVETWRAARTASVASLTPESLARTTTITGIGEVPVAGVVTLLMTDTLVHTWDVGHALGVDVELDPGLVAVVFDWARSNVVRQPGSFGPEVTPPADADEQTRMLAFLGRQPWQPVPA